MESVKGFSYSKYSIIKDLILCTTQPYVLRFAYLSTRDKKISINKIKIDTKPPYSLLISSIITENITYK